MLPLEPVSTPEADQTAPTPMRDIPAARERHKRRAAALKLVLPDLERLVRTGRPEAGAVRQLLDGYAIATAEAAAYREMYAALEAVLTGAPDA